MQHEAAHRRRGVELDIEGVQLDPPLLQQGQNVRPVLHRPERAVDLCPDDAVSGLGSAPQLPSLRPLCQRGLPRNSPIFKPTAPLDTVWLQLGMVVTLYRRSLCVKG